MSWLTTDAAPLIVGCAPLGPVEDFAPTQVRAPRRGHPYGPVGLLVVLQDHDDPARGGERAVERGRYLRARVAVAVAMFNRRVWHMAQFDVDVSSR